jgi:hypothetical protein
MIFCGAGSSKNTDSAVHELAGDVPKYVQYSSSYLFDFFLIENIFRIKAR